MLPKLASRAPADLALTTAPHLTLHSAPHASTTLRHNYHSTPLLTTPLHSYTLHNYTPRAPSVRTLQKPTLQPSLLAFGLGMASWRTLAQEVWQPSTRDSTQVTGRPGTETVGLVNGRVSP